jgi:hypothetical protein
MKGVKSEQLELIKQYHFEVFVDGLVIKVEVFLEKANL